MKVSPESVELAGGDVQAFSGEPHGVAVKWDLMPRAGTIDELGIYLAPPAKEIPNIPGPSS